MPLDVDITEWVGVVLGALMVLFSSIVLVSEWRDWRHAESPAQVEVGRRMVASRAYYVTAKILIWFDMIIIFLVRYRHFSWLRRMIASYPLILFFILLAAMGLLTLNNVIEWRWRNGLAITMYRIRGQKP